MQLEWDLIAEKTGGSFMGLEYPPLEVWEVAVWLDLAAEARFPSLLRIFCMIDLVPSGTFTLSTIERWRRVMDRAEVLAKEGVAVFVVASAVRALVRMVIGKAEPNDRRVLSKLETQLMAQDFRTESTLLLVSAMPGSSLGAWPEDVLSSPVPPVAFYVRPVVRRAKLAMEIAVQEVENGVCGATVK